MICSNPALIAVQPNPGDMELIQVLHDVEYVDDRLPGGRLIVTRGTTSDGASIPYGFRWLVGQPYYPPYWRGALLHDVIYRYEHLRATISRRDADDMFMELLIEDNASRLRTALMWAALRLVAGIHWRW